MHALENFADIVKTNEPLAPYTHLKIGGPAEMLVQPRTRAELAAVVKHCFQRQLSLRVLGGGCNVLVRDEGVKGVVLRLSEPAFAQVVVEGRRVRAGAGAHLAAVISQAARNSLAGLETLVGIPGTVGGALRSNAGDRSGDIGRFVHAVEVMDSQGQVEVRQRDELRFAAGWSNLDDPVLLSAEFDLEPDQPGAIVKHMRKAWIQRKARQPLSFQAAARMFKNPGGKSAADLIDQTGLAKTKVGGAEISERDANCLVAQPGAGARDLLRLLDLVQSRVRDRFHVELEREITIW